MEFQAKVNVWAYTEPNPLFGEYTTRLYRRFHVYFGKKPDDILEYRIFVNENFTAFHNEQEYVAWLKTYKGAEFKTETGTVVFLYRKQELLIPKKDWDNLSLPIDTRLINGLIDIKYQVDDESKVITEYRYTNQNDCKVCHYEKPYGKASESL